MVWGSASHTLSNKLISTWWQLGFTDKTVQWQNCQVFVFKDSQLISTYYSNSDRTWASDWLQSRLKAARRETKILLGSIKMLTTGSLQCKIFWDTNKNKLILPANLNIPWHKEFRFTIFKHWRKKKLSLVQCCYKISPIPLTQAYFIVCINT